MGIRKGIVRRGPAKAAQTDAPGPTATMQRLNLDLALARQGGDARHAATDRQSRVHRSDAPHQPATERAKQKASRVTWGEDLSGNQAVRGTQGVHDKDRDLPVWVGTKKKGEGLTSEQFLSRIVRREIVSREGAGQRQLENDSWKAWKARQKSVLEGGQETTNFAMCRSRWSAQEETGMLPRIKSSASNASRMRTSTAQLFRSNDLVDEWSYGLSREDLGANVAKEEQGRRTIRKRNHVELLADKPPQHQDKLGLPTVLPQKPKPPKSSRLNTETRPGTTSRPGTDYRPKTQARIARIAEQQRKQDMPEPLPVMQPVQDAAKIDALAVLDRLVQVASTGHQEIIDAHVPEPLEQCAELCRQSRFADAEKLYRAVLHYSPQNATALCNLGVIVERVHNNPIHAMHLYEQALKISGDQDTTCLIHLARVTYRTTSDISKPRGFLQKVLAIDPTHSGALSNMALLLLSEYARSSSHLDKIATGNSPDGAMMFRGSGVWGANSMMGNLPPAGSATGSNFLQNSTMWSPSAVGKNAKRSLEILQAANKQNSNGDVKHSAISAAAFQREQRERELRASSPTAEPQAHADAKPQRIIIRRESGIQALLKGPGEKGDAVSEAVSAATEAVKLAETFFWKAHDSAALEHDTTSMALALGNIATIHKLVFTDMCAAENFYKRAIKYDPRHPVLRRNFARLYHDLFEEKVQVITALARGKATAQVKQKGRTDRTAVQLGGIAEAEYRAALELCGASNLTKEKKAQSLKLDLCLNLAALLSHDAMGKRLPEARMLYQAAWDCDESNLEAALGCGAIMWERENRLQEAEVIVRTALNSKYMKLGSNKKWRRMRTSIKHISVLNSVKADHLTVQKKTFSSSLMHASNYMDLSHFESKTWELKASSVFQNLEKFSAGAVFDADASKEWATESPEKSVGEWVYVHYSQPYIVSKVMVKQRGTFAQMVRKLAIYFDGGENRMMILEPETHDQELTFDPPIITEVVRFEICQGKAP